MHGYAQTNLQLYAQLGAAGWSESELGRVARGYGVAMQVCGASIRPNGKPFLCHLVGTAGILASWEAAADEVVGGLVHSVYTHGVWTDEPPGVTDGKRAVLREAVGSDAEELVAEYTRLRWTPTAIEQWAGDTGALSSGERSAVRIRLANELEDHLDLGMRFSRKTKAASSPGESDALLVLAERLVGREFSDELGAAIADNAAGTVPAALVRDDKSSFRPAAASSRGSR